MGWRDLLPDPWTSSQRRLVLGLVILLMGVIYVQHWRYPYQVDDPQLLVSPRDNELADRIDPNTVDAITLASLPTLGEKRAREIISYRERYVREHPAELAFKEETDLLRVRGIGGAMLATLRPYLIFPSDPRPTTHP